MVIYIFYYGGMILKKDILDELELKNKENLFSNRFNNNSATTMSREMETLKINDDSTNEEFIEDDFGIVENNSYISLSEILEKNNS